MWKLKPSHQLLPGRKPRRNDSMQGEKPSTANSGSPQVADEPFVRVPSPPRANAEQQPQSNQERNHRSARPADKPPVGVPSLPHANAKQQTQTDRDCNRRPMRVADKPPVIEPADAEQHDRSSQVAEESPAVAHTLLETSAEQQSQIRTVDHATVQGSQVFEGPSAIVSIEELEIEDIVIAIMGPTGSGKSTFIRRVTGLDTQGIGHSLKSCTSEVLTFKFWDQASRRHVVLVDTPGFDDTFKSDFEILNMISDWLNQSYKKQKLLSGILYFHRITDNRMAGTPLKNLRIFRKLCGKDALDKVYLTTTMWDEVDPEVGEKRLAELSEEYWKAMILQGAQIARCRNDDDSPKKIIQQIIGEEAVRKVLLLQEEMTDMKTELKETEAGQELYSQLEQLVEKQMTLLKRINKERKAAFGTSMMEELQAEYNELQTQIDDRLRQMQELKLSRFKNLRRIFSRKRE